MNGTVHNQNRSFHQFDNRKGKQTLSLYRANIETNLLKSV